MKMVITVCSLVLMISQVVHADNCQDRLTDSGWPNDHLVKILKCKLKSISVGDESNSYGDSICFGIKKTEYSDYKNTYYTILRFNEGEVGALSDIVIINSKGEVSDKANSIKIDGDLIIMTNKHYSFSNGQKWKTESIINMNNMQLTFNSYDKKFFSYSKDLSTNYTCRTDL